jgi:Fe-S oxidoreductase
MPEHAAAQPESTTPTALAMIALAVSNGQLPFDASTRAALARLAGARSCAAACPYGYDIAALVAEFAAQRSEAPAVASAP